MPAAEIVFSSNPTDPPGSTQLSGVGQVDLRNSDDTGVTAWQWDLIDRPSASVAVMVDPLTASPHFVTDVPGTYLVRLRINGGVDEDIRAAYILTARRFLRIPAAGERLEVHASKGWMGAVEDFMTKMDRHGVSHGPSGADAAPVAAPDAIQVGQTGAEGTGGSLTRSDHTHGVPRVAPVDLAAGGLGVEGAGGSFSDGAHRHAAPAGAPSGEVGPFHHEASAGSSSEFVRRDHQHRFTDPTDPEFGWCFMEDFMRQPEALSLVGNTNCVLTPSGGAAVLTGITPPDFEDQLGVWRLSCDPASYGIVHWWSDPAGGEQGHINNFAFAGSENYLLKVGGIRCNTSTMNAFAGLITDKDNMPLEVDLQSGVFIRKEPGAVGHAGSSNFFGVCKVGGGFLNETVLDLNVSAEGLAGIVRNRFWIRRVALGVEFYVDGTLVGIITTNIPESGPNSLGPALGAQRTGDAIEFDFDYLYIRRTGLTR